MRGAQAALMCSWPSYDPAILSSRRGWVGRRRQSFCMKKRAGIFLPSLRLATALGFHDLTERSRAKVQVAFDGKSQKAAR